MGFDLLPPLLLRKQGGSAKIGYFLHIFDRLGFWIKILHEKLLLIWDKIRDCNFSSIFPDRAFSWPCRGALDQGFHTWNASFNLGNSLLFLGINTNRKDFIKREKVVLFFFLPLYRERLQTINTAFFIFNIYRIFFEIHTFEIC